MFSKKKNTSKVCEMENNEGLNSLVQKEPGQIKQDLSSISPHWSPKH